jgi:two-component system osmolarity sensor histidine kinase EnvZ
MVADLADMNAIIDQFVDLRGEAAEPLSGVNLSELARVLRGAWRARGRRARRWLVTLRSPCRPLAMQRVVDNLIANAARHAGGEILVRTAVGEGQSRFPSRPRPASRPIGSST